jgi:MFS family permease
MNQLEKRTAFSLASVYAVRMLGLFMILPVLPLYAKSLVDVTPFLIGVAIGIYGLTQAVFQIPLGLISDRLGRKPVIIGGLLVFALGSLIAAMAHDSIMLIILGRAIQGMGAIAAATMALAADLTREDHRAKVMAAIGMTIGIAFAAAMIIGPLLNEWGGISGVFWVTMVLALLAILLVAFVVPQPVKLTSHRDAGVIGGYIKPVLANATLLRMNIGIFLLHTMMTANFSVLPLIFRDELGLANTDHWKIYLPVFFFSFVLSVPLIIIAEKYRKIKPLFLLSIGLLILAQVLLGMSQSYIVPLLGGFLLFFIGFNFLEAVQPSLVAKYSDVNTKGTAMGVFSTSQFMGIFAGGTVGGFLLTHWGISSVLYFGAILGLLWLLVAISLPTPVFYTSKVFRLRDDLLEKPELTAQQLSDLVGVREVAIAVEEGAAYLKIEASEFDDSSLLAFEALR